jgi:hypothetical protein
MKQAIAVLQTIGDAGLVGVLGNGLRSAGSVTCMSLPKSSLI